jgi:hypothetical protein
MAIADLLRTDMKPECYIPDEKIRNLRALARRRHYFVNTRTMFKNKVLFGHLILLLNVIAATNNNIMITG